MYSRSLGDHWLAFSQRARLFEHELPPGDKLFRGTQWSIVPRAHLSQKHMPGRCREGSSTLEFLPAVSAKEKWMIMCVTEFGGHQVRVTLITF